MSDSQKKIEQLLQDDSFVRWINGEADEAEVRRWNQWLRQDPARFDLVEEARQMYNALTFEEEIPETISELNKLRDAVKEYESSKNKHLSLHEYSGKKKTSTGLWVSVAAVLILLICMPIVVQTVGWDVSLNKNKTESPQPVYKTATTEYGQIQKLTLWDGSRIVLSANSSLTYPQNYKGGNLDVTLEGKAYFSIEHKTENESRKFTVKTPEGNVTVLGTKFNINTRSNETEVVLEEGNVQLNMTDTLGAVKSTYSYTMEPGERALFSPQRKGIDVQTTDPSLFTTWRNLEFKFHNTPLEEIAQRVEEFYGVEVKFRDEKLKNVKFSGTVTNKNFEVLLEGLRVLLDIPITVENETIFFGR